METILTIMCCKRSCVTRRNILNKNCKYLLISLGWIYIITAFYLYNININNHLYIFICFTVNGSGNIFLPSCFNNTRNNTYIINTTRTEHNTEYIDIESSSYLNRINNRDEIEPQQNTRQNPDIESAANEFILNEYLINILSNENFKNIKKIHKWKNNVNIINDNIHCDICFDDKTLKCIFDNCEHYICCECLILLKKNECPFCRKKIVK